MPIFMIGPIGVLCGILEVFGPPIGEGNHGVACLARLWGEAGHPRLVVKIAKGENNSGRVEISAFVALRGIPQVPSIYGWGEGWLAVEYGGPDLLSHFRLWPPGKETFLAIVFQMLAGIKAIHDRSVLHLDIKPENCVWDPETKTLKFLDFGIARSFIPGGHRDEAYLCAPAYRAPSAWIQEGLNEVLDLFALGVVIAELFRGFQERLFPIDPRASHPDLRARIARLGISSFADLERYPVYKEFLIERDGELHFRDGMRPAIDPLPRFLEKGLERRGGRDGELLGLVKELLANLLSRTPDVSRAIDLVQAHQDGFLLDRPPAT